MQNKPQKDVRRSGCAQMLKTAPRNRSPYSSMTAIEENHGIRTFTPQTQSNELAAIQAEMFELRRRFTVLDRNIQSDMSLLKRQSMDRRLFSLRMHLRHDIFVACQAPLRSQRLSNASDFAMSVRREHLSVSSACDLDLFSFLVDDILRSGVIHNTDVMVFPSVSELADPAQGMKSAYIVFKDGSHLIRWLGVRDVLDKENIMMKICCTKNMKSVRVMGGCQWDEDDHSHHMAFFPGMSCLKKKRNAFDSCTDMDHFPGETQNDLAHCLFRPNAIWNKTSEKFVLPYEFTKLTPTLPFELGNVDDLSAFVLHWRRSEGVSRMKWSCDASLTEDITIGTLSVDLPFMQCYGNKTCADVQRFMKQVLKL